MGKTKVFMEALPSLLLDHRRSDLLSQRDWPACSPARQEGAMLLLRATRARSVFSWGSFATNLDPRCESSDGRTTPGQTIRPAHGPAPADSVLLRQPQSTLDYTGQPMVLIKNKAMFHAILISTSFQPPCTCRCATFPTSRQSAL